MRIRTEHRRRGDRSRRLELALAAFACAFAAAVGAGPSAAAGNASSAIASPKANQAVKGTLRIKPRVKAKRGPYRVRVNVDGKLYDQQPAGTRAEAQSSVPIDTTELKNGRHRITVTVYGKSNPRRVSQSVRINVANTGKTPAGSGQAAPVANRRNFRLIMSEGFDLGAPQGTIVNGESPDTPVYTGSTGTPWLAYPSTFFDTFLHHPYRPTEVLSVHNSVLDFWLHPVAGKTSGASVSPILPNGTQYQTYGRYSARMRIGNAPVSQYGAAFLLWPYDNEDYEFSESDFPENQLMRGRDVATGYAHYGRNSTQEYIFSKPIDFREWHTYSQEWMPGKRKFYLDDKLIYTTTQKVWSGPMRWQLQVQSMKNGRQNGHMYIDWAAVWSYVPGTKAG